MKNMIRNLLLLSAVVLMGACEEDAFKSSSSNDGGASKVALDVSSRQLGSSNSDTVDLTAIVTDANNAVVPGVSVIFATTDAGSRIVVTQSTTDDNGEAKAKLSAGSNPSNRTILVTASVGSASETTAIDVEGTTVTINGASALASNGTTTLTVTLTDSADINLTQKDVTAVSSLGNTLATADDVWITDKAGQLDIVYTAAPNTGSDTITVAALGATATHTIAVSGDAFVVGVANEINIGACGAVTATWYMDGSPAASQSVTFSSTKGSLYSDAACSTPLVGTRTTAANGIATAWIMSDGAGPSTVSASATGVAASATTEFIATTPSRMTFQASASSVNPNESVTLKAKVFDASNNVVKNQPITFHITKDTTGGSIAPGVAVTNSLGEASTVYTASDQSSQTDGVQIEAYITNQPTIKAGTSLTVGQKALYITAGMANAVQIETDAYYLWPGVVNVADANSNAVPNQKISLRVVPLYYEKGTRVWNGSVHEKVSSIADNAAFPPADPPLESAPPSAAWEGQVDFTPGTAGGQVCTNEDMRSTDSADYLNGSNDDSPVVEDYNSNGMLTPGSPAVIEQFVVTNDKGFAEFSIGYPKDVANWTYVRLTATAIVEGSESVHRSEFWLTAAAEDVSQEDAEPPGKPSPYGTGTACTDPN